MSNLTYDQAEDEILSLHKEAWDTTGYVALYPNTKEESPKSGPPWTRVTLRHATGRQATLGGRGHRTFERTGVLVAQIFVPIGNGLQFAYQLAKVLSDAFEGGSTDGGVWFRDVRLNEVGRSGNFYQVNFTAEFVYDEIK